MLQNPVERPTVSRAALPQTAANILIVEDDDATRILLSRLLCEAGYDVAGAASWAEMSRIFSANSHANTDLILLDIMLPDADGLALCQSIREYSDVPIIMVSARGLESDHVAGLDRGADDYIAKPFGRAELLARVRAALRRANRGAIGDRPREPDVFLFSGWRFFPKRRELLSPLGSQVMLTAAEEDLLHAFLNNPHRALGRARLLELVRHRLKSENDRSIDVLVSRLRRKLGTMPQGEALIRSIRGVGYTLASDVIGGVA